MARIEPFQDNQDCHLPHVHTYTQIIRSVSTTDDGHCMVAEMFGVTMASEVLYCGHCTVAEMLYMASGVQFAFLNIP